MANCVQLLMITCIMNLYSSLSSIRSPLVLSRSIFLRSSAGLFSRESKHLLDYLSSGPLMNLTLHFVWMLISESFVCLAHLYSGWEQIQGEFGKVLRSATFCKRRFFRLYVFRFVVWLHNKVTPVILFTSGRLPPKLLRTIVTDIHQYLNKLCFLFLCQKQISRIYILLIESL